MIYRDYETMIYGDNNQQPLAYVVQRALDGAEEWKSDIQITITVTSDKDNEDLLWLPDSFVVTSNYKKQRIVEAIHQHIIENVGYTFTGEIRVEFSHPSDAVFYASFARRVNTEYHPSITRSADMVGTTDYAKVLFTPDFEKVIKRVVADAMVDEKKLKVEVRVKELHSTASKQEHSFIVDPNKELCSVEHLRTVIHDRLIQSPGFSFEGQLRINFYPAEAMGTKYGSFTRQIRTTAAADDADSFFPESVLGEINMRTTTNFFSGDDWKDVLGDDSTDVVGLREANHRLEAQVDELIKIIAKLV